MSTAADSAAGCTPGALPRLALAHGEGSITTAATRLALPAWLSGSAGRRAEATTPQL